MLTGMLAGMPRWLAAAVLAAGCYRSSPPPAPPEPTEPARPVFQEPQASYAHARLRPAQPLPERGQIAEAIAKLGEFADDMCACTDKTCADAVSQELREWSTELKDHLDQKPTEEEVQEVSRITDRLSKCMMTAMGYGSSTTPTSPPTP